MFVSCLLVANLSTYRELFFQDESQIICSLGTNISVTPGMSSGSS